jgi:hypothetical protein
MRASKSPDPMGAEDQSDVIVDFLFEDGLIFVTVANIGDRPAFKVSCRFNASFSGLEGSVEIPRLPLFRNIEFLAPRKEIRTLVDSSASYFARKEPTKLEVTVAYWDEDGNRHQATVAHDLSIYRALTYVVPPGEAER